jgi:hypothetical protein
MEAQAAALAGDPAAHRLGEEAIELADEVGRPFPRALSRTFGAWDSVFSFEPRHALDRANDALALCDRFGFNLLACLAVPAHAWASAHLGEDPHEHASRIEEAIDAIRASGNLGSETHALTLLAEVRLLAGDIAGARTSLARAKSIPGGYPPLVDRVERKLASH